MIAQPPGSWVAGSSPALELGTVGGSIPFVVGYSLHASARGTAAGRPLCQQAGAEVGLVVSSWIGCRV